MEAWKHSVETGSIYQIEHRIQTCRRHISLVSFQGIPVRNEGRDNKVVRGSHKHRYQQGGSACSGKSENQLKALNQDLENLVAKRTEQVAHSPSIDSG